MSAKLYEEIGVAWDKNSSATIALGNLRDSLRIATVVDINNVAEYYFAKVQDWGYGDFPNIAPPFPCTWMEYEYPLSARHLTGGRAMVGALFVAGKREDGDGWEVEAYLFAKTGHRRVLSQFSTISFISQDGALEQIDIRAMPTVPDDDFITTEQRNKIACDLITFGIGPCLLATSLMHCKNVEMVENTPHKLPVTKKRQQHPPRTKFYTLNIKPMQRILETEGNASTTGLKMALHICRGHFKDFSHGGGLFGKYKGMYWWESQVRGSKEYGEVKKTYSVKPE